LLNTDKMETEELLKVAKSEAQKRGIKDVVVASTTGDTGLKAAGLFAGSGVNLVVVAHSVGFREPNVNEFDLKAKEEIEKMGGHVLFSTMPFHAINDAIRKKMGSEVLTLIADTLRMLGQGTKVCVEMVSMACDAGRIDSGKEVMAVAGTGRGADTILVIKSENSRRFFDMKIVDVVAKPHSPSQLPIRRDRSSYKH
jgi:hypothetical protein